MSVSEAVTLKSLRDRPFELLAELERRGRAVTAAAASENPGAREWVGVAFRMAGELYLAAREETREVLAVPPGLTRIPGAKTWVKGIANVRGQLLPILDLRQYLGSGVTPNSRNVRVWSITAMCPPACWSTKCWASAAFPNPNSPVTRRRPWCVANVISRAHSSAAPNSGRC
jgi:hypothetical protein